MDDGKLSIAPGDDYLEKASEIELVNCPDGTEFKHVTNALAYLLDVQTTRDARHAILLYIVQAIALHFAVHSGIDLDDLGVRDLGLRFPGDDKEEKEEADDHEKEEAEDDGEEVYVDAVEVHDVGPAEIVNKSADCIMGFLRLN